MGFLQRSKSAAVVDQNKRGRKDEAVADHPDIPLKDDFAKKSMSQERPKTADDRRSRSFSRPRTATRVKDCSIDIPIPGETIQIKAGNETFDFPTPSPRLPPKSATFQLTPSPLNLSGSPAIGVALGSPSHPPSQPAMPNWGRSFTADHISNRMPFQQPPARPPPAIPERVESDAPSPEVRRKKSSWKTFGGLFGRKQPKQAVEEPFYKLRLPQEHNQLSSLLRPTDAAADTPSPGVSPGLHGGSSPTPGPHRRTPSMTRGMARFEARAEADLASFNPNSKPRKMRSPSMIQKEGFSPMFRALGSNYPRDSEEMFRAVPEERTDSPLSMREKTGLGASPSTPRLDLDLPDPKFERYSVMFEKLLDDRKPSLLERRQSKLQRTRSIRLEDDAKKDNEDEVMPLPTANTTPQRSMSTTPLKKSLSIRVGTKANGATVLVKEQDTAVNRPRPIQRSKTAPPGAVSPLAQGFAKAKIAILGRSPQSPSTAENDLPATPMTITTLSDSDSVAIINNDLGTLQRNMDQTEPSWDMVTSNPTKIVVEDYSGHKLRVKSPEDLDRQIVQVSVARQVSVSKARKQVQQATASKQPLRPRVVELSKDRKSTVVLIETGDEDIPEEVPALAA